MLMVEVWKEEECYSSNHTVAVRETRFFSSLTARDLSGCGSWEEEESKLR